MKCYEERVEYLIERSKLSMGDCFLWHGEAYIVSNRGDINLSNGCSESICAEAEVDRFTQSLFIIDLQTEDHTLISMIKKEVML
jgi:hypothetical protein